MYFQPLLKPVHHELKARCSLDRFEGAPILERIYIHDLLTWGFPIDLQSGARLRHALIALNFGELQSLLEPDRKGRLQPAYTIARLQLLAAVHVNFLHGYGLQKKSARLRVANAYGIGANDNIETVRSWEQKAVREFRGQDHTDYLKQGAKKLGEIIKGQPIDGLVNEKQFIDLYYPRLKKSMEPNISSDKMIEAWEVSLKCAGKTLFNEICLAHEGSNKDVEHFVLSLATDLIALPLKKCGELYQQARQGDMVELPIPESPFYSSNSL